MKSDDIGVQEKLDFFYRANVCFGRSALMLSGGGVLGFYHLGVVKTLLDQGLLPRVISGSSAGSLRAAVFVCGAVLGRISRKLVLRLSQNGGGLEKHKALIHKAREAVRAIAPLLPRRRPPSPDWDIVAPGGCAI